jgi:hypothetical protein
MFVIFNVYKSFMQVLLTIFTQNCIYIVPTKMHLWRGLHVIRGFKSGRAILTKLAYFWTPVAKQILKIFKNINEMFHNHQVSTIIERK